MSAEIIAQAKGDKVTVFKKRRRHNYRRKQGHRQQHTILKVTAIGDQKAETKAAKPKAESEAPAAAPAKETTPAPAAKADAKPNADKPKKAETEAPKAKAPSTKDAAPAKAAAKKTPKAK